MEANNLISVVILTKNEEQDLPACLDALISWCDDIIILDSGSTDQTLAIAAQYHTSVHFRPFDSFGAQRNYALNNLPIRHEWVLFLDADEVVTPQFLQAMQNATEQSSQDIVGFYCCWKMILEGRWLKRCDNFPKWQFRLLRKGRASFIDFGHGQKEGEFDGKIRYIKEPYLHYGFSKGWSHWIERHNKYSTLEAQSRLQNTDSFTKIWKVGSSSKRNIILRSKLSKLPGWPFLRFFQAYILNLGFMEGKQGFIYCVNMAYYEFLIKIKMRELLLKQRTRQTGGTSSIHKKIDK